MDAKSSCRHGYAARGVGGGQLQGKNSPKGKSGIGGVVGGPQGFRGQQDGGFSYFVDFFIPVFSTVVLFVDFVLFLLVFGCLFTLCA